MHMKQLWKKVRIGAAKKCIGTCVWSSLCNALEVMGERGEFCRHIVQVPR